MKLSPLTIIFIGFAFAISVLSYAYFQIAQPNYTEAGYYQETQVLEKTEADKRQAAIKRVIDAKAAVKLQSDRWKQVVAVRTPPGSVAEGGINLAVNAYQLTVDSRKFRNNIQRAVNKQLLRGGVKVVSAPLIPEPEDSFSTVLASYYNYPAIGFPVVIFDLGSVTVTGTYSQIMQHVRSYKSMPRYLAVTDGLTLEGTSPKLTATYNLTIVGYIPGKDIFPAIPEGGLGTIAGVAPASTQGAKVGNAAPAGVR